MHPRRAALHAELEGERGEKQREGGDKQRQGGDRQREGACMHSEREAEARKHLVLVLMQARIACARCIAHSMRLLVPQHSPDGAMLIRWRAAPGCYKPMLYGATPPHYARPPMPLHPS